MKSPLKWSNDMKARFKRTLGFHVLFKYKKELKYRERALTELYLYKFVYGTRYKTLV